MTVFLKQCINGNGLFKTFVFNVLKVFLRLFWMFKKIRKFKDIFLAKVKSSRIFLLI